MTEVFVVIRTETDRQVIVAICASRQRAERYVAAMPYSDELRIEAWTLLH